MKKSLIILALALQTNASYSDPQIKTQAKETENIETVVETTYKHPKARKVRDLMPQPEGEIVSRTIMTAINKITGEIKNLGLSIDYDRNPEDEKNIPEYKFIRRFCDVGRDVITYAVLDIPNNKLYVDSSRNRYIDLILEGNALEIFIIPGIPVECEQDRRLSDAYDFL